MTIDIPLDAAIKILFRADGKPRNRNIAATTFKNAIDGNLYQAFQKIATAGRPNDSKGTSKRRNTHAKLTGLRPPDEGNNGVRGIQTQGQKQVHHLGRGESAGSISTKERKNALYRAESVAKAYDRAPERRRDHGVIIGWWRKPDPQTPGDA